MVRLFVRPYGALWPACCGRLAIGSAGWVIGRRGARSESLMIGAFRDER
ncbi:MAG: hypothetical protein INF89_14350 [Roseomonas sp.]|nr:hypothetical protein [Roseomonas sp.]